MLGNPLHWHEMSFEKKDKKQVLWIVDRLCLSEPKYGGISRQYDFGVELSKRGYRVVVISSSYIFHMSI